MSSNSTSTVVKLLNVLTRPSHLGLLIHDWLGRSHPVQSDEEHLDAAIQWLLRAQDAAPGGGVAGGYYCPYGGWLEPYPETTGYIIPTLMQYGQRLNDPEFLQRAIRLGDWEIEIQLEDGAVRGGVGVNTYPIVFNTGQVIIGWAALARETKEARFQEAAVRAADWLVKVQDKNGKWSQFSHNNAPHAYHTRVAWPVLEVYALTGDEKYKACAQKHLEWVLSGAEENGWCAYMGFTPEENPLTHTIAYTIRGLLECAVYFDDYFHGQIMNTAQTASENLLLHYERRKPSPELSPRPLSANLDKKWKPAAQYSCVTGDAQLGIIWLKLFKQTGDARYLNGALKILDYVKSTQSLTAGNLGIRGAVPGSSPCWGKYNPFSFPNWATKFFADALMLQIDLMKSVERDVGVGGAT